MKRFLSLITLALFGLSLHAQVITSFPAFEGFENGADDDEFFMGLGSGWQIYGNNQSTTSGSPISQGVNSSHYAAAYYPSEQSMTYSSETMAFEVGDYDNAKLSFYYANPEWESDYDELQIGIRFSAYDSYTTVWTSTGSHDEWTYVEISLPVNNTNVQLEFSAVTNYGYGIFLDRMEVDAWNDNQGGGTDYVVVSGSTSASDVPASSVWNYSFNEMIYNYSSIPGPSSTYFRINSISFYYMGLQGGGVLGYNRNVNIYMKNVTRTDFSDGQFEPVTAEHLVYSGYMTGLSEGWITVVLDRPFYYKNYFDNHILIAIDDNTGSYVPGTLGYFKMDAVNSASMRYTSDSNNPDPYNITTGSIVNYRPALKINYDNLQPATMPYVTDFENDDWDLWMLKNTTGDGYANWFFHGLVGKYDYPALMCGVDHSMSYNVSDHRETVLAERLIQLSQADKLKIQFNVTVGGESNSTMCYDYVMAFLAPATENWEPVSGGNTYPAYVGLANEYNLPYALHFGEGVAGTKLVNMNDETVSTIINNPGKGQLYKLIFAWSNDPSAGSGTAVAIDDISITNDGEDGVEENSESSLSVMPNPANDVIRVNGLIGMEEVNIYNTLGQVVKSARLNNGESLSISDLSAGVYMLRGENSAQVVKFTVK